MRYSTNIPVLHLGVECARNNSSVKRSTAHADVLQKFRKMTAAHLSTATQDEMIALCERLETVADTAVLLALLELGS